MSNPNYSCLKSNYLILPIVYIINKKSKFLFIQQVYAICYAIGRLRRECYLPALKIQQRCDKSASYFLFSTTEKSAFT